MIEDPAYTVEPWGIRETHLDLEKLAQSESVFAQSNGHIGIRGTLDEREPSALPGTYLNAFWEARPLPYAEAGFGYPEAGETVVNMTNGKIIRLLVDDSPFDIRYGELLEHERRLDFRSGILRRVALWRSPTGKTVRVTSERLVVDEQADELAVGDVEDRLTGLRVAVAGLGVGERTGLVEGVQVGAGQPVGVALVEVPPHPDVAVRQREQ